ncbi:MAG: glycerol kinase GlpK [Candidatus Omnitrophica bacterium]|nr:glycerol kinase GlpK [Candidatus Omnitrophota bacterium]
MAILALDLGTTGNRAIVFDRNQNILSEFYEEFPQIYPRPGWVEHDPERIWRGVQKILAQTFKKIPPEQIAAIGVTNQRETVLLWDKKTGRPLHHAIVWQCRRTAAFCEALKKKVFGALIHNKTGLVIDAYFSASKIRWLLDEVKGARARAEKGEILAGTIDTWIVWKLSNGRRHVTDTSNASRTMLFDIHEKKWDPELCRIFRVPEKILPRVVPSSGVAGVTDEKICGREIPVAGIVGDQQGASFAQGCFAPGIVKNTYGTGLFMLENTGRTPRFSKNLLTTVAWSIGDLAHTEYALEGSVFIGGAAIQWLRDGLGILKNAGESEKLAAHLASNEGVYFVPALVGLGAPYWDSAARGLVIGLTRGTTRAHLARAALEAIAFQTREILELMKKEARAAFRVLRADGGASANDFLMQFQADMLGIPVERPEILETTALGAAGLAGMAVGFWKDKNEFNRKRKIERVFHPRKMARREAVYARWKEAARRALQWA